MHAEWCNNSTLQNNLTSCQLLAYKERPLGTAFTPLLSSSGQSNWPNPSCVPKVACDLPLQEASGVRNLDFLKDLHLADPNFDMPGKHCLARLISLLAPIFSRILSWLTSNVEALINLLLCGPFSDGPSQGRYKPDPEHHSSHSAQVCCLVSAPSSDELLKRFWETE